MFFSLLCLGYDPRAPSRSQISFISDDGGMSWRKIAGPLKKSVQENARRLYDLKNAMLCCNRVLRLMAWQARLAGLVP